MKQSNNNNQHDESNTFFRPTRSCLQTEIIMTEPDEHLAPTLLDEHELLVLPEHSSLRIVSPVMLWVLCYSIFNLLCSVVSIIVYIFVATVLSFRLFMASEYLFNIFKFFLETDWFDNHVPNSYFLIQNYPDIKIIFDILIINIKRRRQILVN